MYEGRPAKRIAVELGSRVSALVMRVAGEVFVGGESEPAMVASYEDRNRERNEARILYKFIMEGGLGDPTKHQDTLKQLQDQISGVNLRGV
jgi:hypothetical protein